MNKLTFFGKWLYATALIAFGIQHFIYADFLTAYVPAWIPWHLFFVYLVAIAFMAAALSITINKHVELACIMLSAMLAMFILLIHMPRLSADPQNVQNWTRALQDVVIMGAALVLTSNFRLRQVGKYLFAIPMIVLGLQHFTQVNFVTVRVRGYIPEMAFWNCLFGVIVVSTAIGIISNRYRFTGARLLALFLLTAIAFYQIPLLVNYIDDGQKWAGAMLELAIAGGAFIMSAAPLTKFPELNAATK